MHVKGQKGKILILKEEGFFLNRPEKETSVQYTLWFVAVLLGFQPNTNDL